MTGSSPLARGLHHMMELLAVTTRIIPARAGFTRQPCCRWPGRPDHPRSRGVYVHVNRGYPWSDGSSPLARGLRAGVFCCGVPPRIIPARAGFTGTRCGTPSADSDHPRSRGVYPLRTDHTPLRTGSSPLARGLLDYGTQPPHVWRIIPARAGFTPDHPGHQRGGRDHPRSRGVYQLEMTGDIQRYGSSPLARGLRAPSGPAGDDLGIIPARAGFTGSAVTGPER